MSVRCEICLLIQKVLCRYVHRHLCYASATPVVLADGSVRVYYGASNGPHDGVNGSTSLGLATLKSSDRFVGFKQEVNAKAATGESAMF